MFVELGELFGAYTTHIISDIMVCLVNLSLYTSSQCHTINQSFCRYVNPLTSNICRHIKTSQLICSANQMQINWLVSTWWGTLVVNRLKRLRKIVFHSLDFQEVLTNECDHNTQTSYENPYFEAIAVSLLWKHLLLYELCVFKHYIRHMKQNDSHTTWSRS